MQAFIATFFTHYGAMSFHRAAQAAGLVTKPMPVPRRLSSSCGVCVHISDASEAQFAPLLGDALECLYAVSATEDRLLINHR